MNPLVHTLPRGYASAVLTPNVNEMRRLAAVLGLEGSSEEAGDGELLVRGISQALGGATVVRKVGDCGLACMEAGANKPDEQELFPCMLIATSTGKQSHESPTREVT